jgi:hypothetical protein
VIAAASHHFRNGFRQSLGERRVDVGCFAQRHSCQAVESAMEFGRVERTNHRCRQGADEFGGQVVDTPTLVRGEIVPAAGQGDHLLAEAVERVPGLPGAPAGDAGSGMQGVAPFHPDHAVGRRLGPPPPEGWPRRTAVGTTHSWPRTGRPARTRGRPATSSRAGTPGTASRPARCRGGEPRRAFRSSEPSMTRHGLRVCVRGESQRQVDVGPFVLPVECCRSDDRRSRHPVIGARVRDESVAELHTERRREHGR